MSKPMEEEPKRKRRRVGSTGKNGAAINNPARPFQFESPTTLRSPLSLFLYSNEPLRARSTFTLVFPRLDADSTARSLHWAWDIHPSIEVK